MKQHVKPLLKNNVKQMKKKRNHNQLKLPLYSFGQSVDTFKDDMNVKLVSDNTFKAKRLKLYNENEFHRDIGKTILETRANLIQF